MTSNVRTSASDAPSAPPRPQAFLGWRLLSLVYDFLPVAALWLLTTVPYALGFTFLGGHDPHENIAPYSLLSWLIWLSCWIVTGLYATFSWGRGGQTLGMRPWRLQLVSSDGTPVSRAHLWRRYAVGTLSLALGGLGFWWALFDRDRLAWHDRASGTRLVRLPKR
jgi:uncharacterized RDD family membrane protein YckC